MRCGDLYGAAAQPNAGQARSPQGTCRQFYLKTLKGLDPNAGATVKVPIARMK
jgi:hypothetical protein